MQHDNLYNIRHSLSHLLAIAVKKKYPHAKLAIGPVIDTGFYYDFDFSGGEAPSDSDLKDLQKQMKKSASSNLDFKKETLNEKEARAFFKNEPYKLELIDEFAKAGEKITVYKTGEFTDLCEGPHVANTKEIDTDAFELSHIAGAYWRGDEKNKMLTRIYGLAFENSEALDAYKKFREEAAKRDHRKIGKEMGLFTFSDLVGPGLPLFTPKGTVMRDAIAEKIRSIQARFGYERVWIPHIAKKELYQTSGHWDKFRDDLFHVKGKANAEFVMKPMNCPHHTQIYASAQRSYKDLPVRFMEVTTNYRDEQPGELLGLSRVRSLTQDDGHVFCTIDQVEAEAKNIVTVIREFYTSLGMFEKDSYWVSLSVRDPKLPEKYLGDTKNWDTAEHMLEKVAKEEKLPYKHIEGEAAFYGPKLDFMFKDAIGREWQLATIQIDFNMPARFGLEYNDKDGKKKTPVMIHRAIAGSLERFLSVIIEHFAGNFPVWLAPVQAIILPIGESHQSYAESVFEHLKKAGIRAEIDNSGETLGKKIRNAKLQKIPYLLVLGDKEKDLNTITVESRDTGSLGQMTIDAFTQSIKKAN
ncbi:MAG: threonine--tRNA ligase [Candidatus Lloydbacteria bacterium]|nr:threonine--tRNA ligase [Candidatus Lloydbacteria bacterium]